MQDLISSDIKDVLVTKDLTTTSSIIARNTNKAHKDVLELIRKHIDDLQEVGRVTFQTLPFETAGGIQKQEVAELDDYSTMLLLTHMRSIGIIKDFKRELVIEFKRMRELLRCNAKAESLDYQKQLALQSDKLATVNQREPRDERTLAVVMGCSTYQVTRHFDTLVRNGYLKRRELAPTVRYVYDATTELGKLCVGKKGDSLLFDSKVKDLVTLLNQTEVLFD